MVARKQYTIPDHAFVMLLWLQRCIYTPDALLGMSSACAYHPEPGALFAFFVSTLLLPCYFPYSLVSRSLTSITHFTTDSSMMSAVSLITVFFAASAALFPVYGAPTSTQTQKQNGLDAQQLNAKFAALTASGPCTGASYVCLVRSNLIDRVGCRNIRLLRRRSACSMRQRRVGRDPMRRRHHLRRPSSREQCRHRDQLRHEGRRAQPL